MIHSVLEKATDTAYLFNLRIYKLFSTAGAKMTEENPELLLRKMAGVIRRLEQLVRHLWYVRIRRLRVGNI